MRKLEYRCPRLGSMIEIEFAVNGETLYGRCKDISASGIRAEFDRPATVGSYGPLVLHHGEGAVRRRAQVAYLDGLIVGVSFLSSESGEGDEVARLIALIASR
jgi:PilZ domain